MNLKMRKVKFDVRGIVRESARKNNFLAKTIILWSTIVFGIFIVSVLSVLEGGIFTRVFSSVLNSFEAGTVATDAVKVKVEFDDGLHFVSQKAPIQYAIPMAKIDNALSFEISNDDEDVRFKGITFGVGDDGCDMIKKAYLTENGSLLRHYGNCNNGRLTIDSFRKKLGSGEKVNYVLSVSLSEKAKVGQHLNFSIVKPQDIDIGVGLDNIYFRSAYPFHISTIYVVGLRDVL